MNFFGERSCKTCISFSKPECSVFCDPLDPIQSKVCHLFFRGQFTQSGQCVRENNLPVCKCSSEPGSFSTESFSSSQSIIPMISSKSVAPYKPSVAFNGNIKFKISLSDGFYRIFHLPNGDFKPEQCLLVLVNIFGILSNGDLISGDYINKALLIWDLNITNGEPLKRIIQTNNTSYFQCMTVLKNDDFAIGYQTDGGIVFSSIPGYTSTNSPLESFNTTIKTDFTHRRKLGIFVFIEKSMDMDIIRSYSIDGQKFYLTLKPTSSAIKLGNQWLVGIISKKYTNVLTYTKFVINLTRSYP
ncbi:unnamed protein product [Brachionus calyciflorus]|uniref:Uncharacterized protein n=1 Tax=Brachionus calyciflorus TaxID=104777 RepID=A0A814LMG9_9BILA|nr:unnamed protein product [Brachionus calyciflorus]